LPVNVTGAMAAVASEMGIPWQICRGLAVAARSVGLVGHVLEEMRQPIATALYLRTEHEATAHLIPKGHQEKA
jgi:citrate synthase